MNKHSFIDDATEPPTRVLLIDDDAVTLLLTAAALRERGFTVVEAASGVQGLQMLPQVLPDVVVLDALMPGLDGFEICCQLRAWPGFESTPVLMLTGLDDDASIARAYEAGATDFFVKSPQWSLLAGRLRYLLRSARTRAELERNRTKLARAQDLARMGSFDWRGGPIVFSQEGLRVLEHQDRERQGLRTLLRLVAPHERKNFASLVRNSLQRQCALATDIPLAPPDGRPRVIHVEAEPEFDERGLFTGFTGIVQDVTDRRLAEDKIRHLANYDALTGLPNRRQLIWRAERALEHARRMEHHAALLLVDLDRFKVVNDTLGHAAGDELLVDVSRRLRGCLRHSDRVVEISVDSASARAHRSLEAIGRLGGDEFVALLPEVQSDRDAEIVAQRILHAMREPIIVGGQECFVSASVGIALFPRDGTNVADLMRNADVAMYTVKGQGRNSVAVYSPELAVRGRDKLELESALHKAIERNELVLHYQPKIDVRRGAMVGAEALMRWQRGSKLVAPGEFIPLAEETGLIVPMSEWALHEAARQAKVWQTNFGFADSIAVNLPNRLFERTDLADRIQASAHASGVPQGAIQLEITETGLMKELQSVMPALHRLNDIGVEIAIDDFGTGYSSLAYLTMLPISELKIDRSFVRDLGLTPQSSAVVNAIIALARSLGLRVVAEGVENVRQMQVLHRLGCNLMQGFLFNRPAPADDIERWLKDVVVPRKAAWIDEIEEFEDTTRASLAGG